MNNKLLPLPLILLTLLAIISCNTNDGIKPISSETPFSIAVCTDIHFLSESLRDGEDAFVKFNESGDGKLIEYGSEIIQALTRDLAARKIDVLIVSGDLTVNGEKASHKDLAGYFRQIEKNGTRVYIIPGNHDINNPYALGFKDDERYFTDSISPDEFRKIFRNFGYREAALKDPASLSYLVKPAENLWLLMLDSNKYENNYQFNVPFSGGRLKEETLNWLEDIAEEKMKSAVPVEIISVTHHNLIPHTAMFSDGFTLDNYRDAGPALSKLGIKLNLSGHIHIQDITYSYDIDMHEIATGSLSVYPQKFGLITIADNELNYRTEWVDVEAWAKGNNSSDPDLLDFQNYSDKKFRNLSNKSFRDRLDADYNNDEIELLASTMSSLNSRYFAGMDSLDKDYIMSSEGFRLWEDSEESFARMYIMTMVEDRDDDNSLNLKLR